MSNYIQNRANQPLMGQALYDEVISRFQLNADAGKTPVAGSDGTIGSDWLPVVPIEKGGTGATNAEQALSNLGGMSSSGGTFSGRTYFTSAGGRIASTSVVGQAQFNSGNTSSAAAITLNRSGYYVNFGVDTDNILKVGGGSMGAVAYPILHSGNWSSYISIPTYSGPMMPTASTFVALNSGNSRLPDGGTWAWVIFTTRANTSMGVDIEVSATSGISAGGTSFNSSFIGGNAGGFAWRIA